MSSCYCSYNGCENVYRSFAEKAFFALPNDSRRSTWIENSGNNSLAGSPLNSRRIFCEDHFDPKDIRRQFNRATLRKDAIPYPFHSGDEMVEITEADELTEPEETDLLFVEQSASNTVDKSSLLNFRLKTLSKPNRIHASQSALQLLDNGDGDSCDNEEIDVIIETNDSSDETPSIDKRSKHRSESSNAPNGGHVLPKRKCYGADTVQQQRSESLAKIVAEPNDTVPGLDALVTSSDANGTTNEEMYFALSLVGILKRLPPQKRAKAKCHIMNYLTELEFGA